MKRGERKISKTRRIVGDILLAICAVFLAYFLAVMIYRLATVVEAKRIDAVTRFLSEFGFMCLLSLPAFDVRFKLFSWNRNKGTKVAGATLRVVSCAICVLFVTLGFAIIITGATTDEQSVDSVCVLGLSIDGDELPTDLTYRLDRAIEYNEQNPGALYVTTGGNSDDPYYSEAEYMKRYLEAKGFDVPEGKLIAETNAKTTVENFKYVAEIVDKTQPLAVITNDYHMFRATKIAKKEGYASIVKVPAKSVPILYLENIMRETIVAIFQTLAGELTY
ncbi:MAG: YdcF family protein [Clostridia bacterium]|nr:YdcF family protein [Clostridia bacterium]